MSLIENSTCKIIVETQGGISEEKGTGFFISKNQILTCKHVIENLTGEIKIQKCYNQNERELTAQIISSCASSDYALLQLTEDFENEHFLELCDSEIVEEENIEIFGYPNDEQGQIVGERLIGKVERILDDSELSQDVSLEIANFAPNTRYNAFSGSPVVNEYDQVISIVKYQAVRNLSSVSIRKAKTFLAENTINIKPDQIVSFEIFNKDVFIGFADRENDCKIESITPISILSPKVIIETNNERLFYPKKNLDISGIIKYLRKNKDVNNKLWKGWIQILTYVEILKGDYKSANSISIKISTKDISKYLGIFNRTKDVDLELFLNFYLTDETDYFKIAQMSIHENRKNDISKHTCNVFNSNIEHFGNTNKFIPDITNPEHSGPSIPNIKIGALSLNQLNRAVIDSQSLLEVGDNLKKVFENAIK